MSWPRLLQCAASHAHRDALRRVWVRLFRVVHSSVTLTLTLTLTLTRTLTLTLTQVRLFRVVHSSDANARAQAEAGAQAEAEAASGADRAAHLRDFFSAVEQMMLGASAGAFS